ncbi:MAG: undecaprenyl/decaprenyl-phosphate alpha-N-acetylglucosaminyl 1-phosphate transferase [Bdellovibrionaceae bacterium]|jgi:UDP-GlcNAc:undecaprenyl-phosphate/decaprenyl-phosphate GlcNAc-1-phosphate transferase|nr:undecaprenyl/decaprenyl-phosphate alpha-N-acetylglucosaminyl 1-phosphate transferase [Pseudobdellovibrionaceae bacterium]
MDISNYWPILGFLSTFFIVSLVVPIFIKFGHKFNFTSKKSFRRKEESSVPLLGGISIYLSLLVVASLFSLKMPLIFLLSALPIVVAGILDDLFEFRARYKALAHISSMIIWFYLVPSESLILYSLGLNSILTIGFTGFWILGMVNAINMIDGMDGESGSFSFLAAGFLAFFFWGTDTATILLALMGAIAGFLIYNRPPAKIYLGDAGSSFLGFFLATTAATIPSLGGSWSNIFIPLFIFAFPEIDAIMAISRRIISRTSPFSGDHDHLHHKLKKLDMSIYQILLLFSGVTVYCGVTAVTLHKVSKEEVVASVLFLAMAGLLTLLGSIYFVEYKLAYKTSTFSQTLLKKYMNLKDKVNINPDFFQATVFDLLPYYKEIQQRGVEDVQSFVQDFAKFVQKHFSDAELKMAGSYSVIIIESPKGEIRKEINPEVVICYFKFLQKHKVQKNDSDLPWGMFFYSSELKRDMFLKKFGLLDDADNTLTEIKKVA